jgi:peptidoglycan/LPS O-acetylase OafA/YrhL
MIFFVISGFVIAFSGERATAFSFSVSRVVRLGPGVWICSTITLLTVWIFAISPNPQLMQGFRHSMLFLPSEPWIDGAFWTLNIEISFYICVLVVIALKRFDKIRALAIAIGLCSSAFILFRGAAEFGVLGPSALSFLGRHYRAVD